MANFKKRAFPLFMALVMILTMLPVDAMAKGGKGDKPGKPPYTGEEEPTTPTTPTYEVGGEYEFEGTPSNDLLPQCSVWEYVGLSTNLIEEHAEHTHGGTDCEECKAENCVDGKLDCPSCENGWVKIGRYSTECHRLGCENCEGDGTIVTKTGFGTMTDGVFTACPHDCDCFMPIFGCYGDCYDDCYCTKQILETKTCVWCDGTGYCHTNVDSTACWKKCDQCGNTGVTNTNCSACEGTGCTKDAHNHENACYMQKWRIVANHTWGDWTPVAGTDTHNRVCQINSEHVDTAQNHNWVADAENSSAPACGVEGVNAFKCSTCNATKTSPVAALTHSFTNYVSDNDAACEANGHETAECDREGCKATDTREIANSATGHKWALSGYTWAEDYSTCTANFVCENDASHTGSTTATVVAETDKATCETAGLVTYTATAVYEGATYTTTATKDLDALGHKWGTPAFVWNGYTCTATVTCEHGCTKTLEVTVTNAVTTEPTCEGEGVRTYTATALFNETAYTSTKTETIESLGHKWAPNGFTWADDYSTCVRNDICVRDNSHTRTRDAVVTSVTTEATCEEDGSVVYTATIPFGDRILTDTKTVTLEALGHEWGEPVFSWAEDGYTCTATVTCERGCSKVLEVTVTGEITTVATCAVDGIKTYTATTVFEGETYTSTKEENLGKNEENHDKDNCECFRYVTFEVKNGKTGKTDKYGPFKVKYGTAAEAPEISVPKGYSLGEWSADFSAVTEDMTVTASITRNFGDYPVALYVGYGKTGSTANWYAAGTGTLYDAYDPLSYGKGYMNLPEGARFEGTPKAVTITKDGVAYTVDGKDFYTLGDGQLVGGESDGYHMDYQAIFWHTVDFVVNGETVKSDKVKHGEDATAPTVTAADGMKFVGWNGSYTGVAKSTTVTAVFTERTDLSYTVNYVDTEGKELAESKIVTGQTFNATATEYAVAMPGYNVDEAEKTITIGAGENVITFTYSKRTDLSYTVSYVDESGEAVAAPKTVGGQTFKAIVTETAKAVEGYTVDAETKSVEIKTEGNEIVFVYSKRTDLSYTVKYVDDAGKELAESKTVTGQTFKATVTETAEAIEGYTVDAETKSTEIKVEDNEIKFVYSKRTDLTYTVNYVDTEGKELSESKTVIGQTFKTTVTETAEAIEGYTVDSETKSIVVEVENNVITFVYTINTYTVSWDEDGDGEAESTTTVTYGEEIALPETNPTKEGHTFNGWVDVPDTMPAGDVTIVASWTVNQYTITFNPNGGTYVAPITQDYGTEVVAPGEPMFTGFYFVGWDTEIPTTMPACNLTITAIWAESANSNTNLPGGEGFEIIEDEEVPLADGSLLNTDEYIAYIAGFEDATVRPEKLITRAEFATIMFRLLNDDFRLENWGTESRFTDVEEDDWFFVEVTTCDNIGLLDHYEGEEFLPNEPITREEVAYIIAMFIEDAYEGEEALFTDIDDSFAFDAINDCKTVGIIGGDGDGKFRPQDTIKRAEVAKMVNLLLGRDAEELVGDLRNWTDNAEGKWYYEFIRVASNSFDADTLEVIEVDADYWKNKKEEWAAAFAALIPEDESEEDEEIEG